MSNKHCKVQNRPTAPPSATARTILLSFQTAKPPSLSPYLSGLEGKETDSVRIRWYRHQVDINNIQGILEPQLEKYEETDIKDTKSCLDTEFQGLLHQDAEKDMLTAVNMPRVIVTVAKLEELPGRECKELHDGVLCGSDVQFNSIQFKYSSTKYYWF